MKTIYVIGGTALLFALMFLIFGPFYTIGAGERGVITRFGQVVGTADPGLGFKTPFVNSVYSIDIQPQVRSMKLAAYQRPSLSEMLRDIPVHKKPQSPNMSHLVGKPYRNYNGDWTVDLG